MTVRRRLAALLLLVALAVACTAGTAGAQTYTHAGVRVTAGGEGADAWFLLEPAKPRPEVAPLAVITHGYGEYAGRQMVGSLAEHTARTGSVVIYTRWQTGVAAPCAGPYDPSPCIASETAGIKGALRYLKRHPRHVQPQLSRTSYFGFSFGGIITANIANRWRQLGLPQPRAIWLDDPHDGGLTGFDEPALDDSLAGIPSSAKVVCHSSAQGVTSEPDKAGASCNAVFPRLTSVPARNKSLVLTSADDHGTPTLAAPHGVCAGPGSGELTYAVDAYDQGFCRRSWDALRACAYWGTFCRYALGDTPQNRYIGSWDDGTPIVGLKVQSAAPISADPAPARAAAPPPNRAPVLTIGRVSALRIRGGATDDDGVISVQVAVVRRAGGRCRQLTPGGKFVAVRSCVRPTRFTRAEGTARWSLTRPERLPHGRYRIVVRATDTDVVRTRIARDVRIG